jgi:hypothetical protein
MIKQWNESDLNLAFQALQKSPKQSVRRLATIYKVLRSTL